jgi:hypothetical protein
MLENTKTILQISTVEERQKKNEMFDTDINFNLSSNMFSTETCKSIYMIAIHLKTKNY